MSRRPFTQPDAVELVQRQWRRERPDMDTSAMDVFGRLHRCFVQYQSEISSIFEAHGINTSSFDVLAALRRSGEPFQLTAGELATTTLVTSGGITLRIDKCVKAGLVERIRDTEDRRVVYARLTDKGRALVDEVSSAHFENEKDMLAGLTSGERKQLGKLLHLLERSLDQHRTASRVAAEDPGT